MGFAWICEYIPLIRIPISELYFATTSVVLGKKQRIPIANSWWPMSNVGTLEDASWRLTSPYCVKKVPIPYQSHSLLFVNQHIGRFFNHNLQLPPKLFGPFWAQKPLVPLKESLVPIAPRPQNVQDLKSKSPGERAKVRTKWREGLDFFQDVIPSSKLTDIA